MVAMPTYEELEQRVKELEKSKNNDGSFQQENIKSPFGRNGQFYAIAEMSSVTIYIMDSKGKCIDVSPSWSLQAGLSLEEALGDGWINGLHLEDKEKVINKWEKMIQSKRKWSLEYRFQPHAGKTIWVYGTANEILDGNGDVTGYIGLNFDITKLKETEALLKDSEKRLTEAHSIARFGSWEWDSITDTVVWSTELYNIFGRDPDKPTPTYRDYPSLCTPENFNRMAIEVRKALDKGIPYHLDLEVIRTDGTIRWVSIWGEPVYDSTGQVTRLHGTIQDITERKKVESALQESEEKYRCLVRDSLDGIAIVDDFEIKFVNPTVLSMFGYQSEGEMLGHLVTDVVSPKDRDRVRETGKKRSSGDDVPDRYEFLALRKDGTEFLAELSVSPIMFEGKPMHQGVLRDITVQKQTEKALQESEEKYRFLAENVEDVIWVSDLEFNISYMSPSIERLTGYTLQEAMKLTPEQWLKPADFEKAKNILLEDSDVPGKQPNINDVKNIELSILHKDGSTVWLEINLSVQYDDEGAPEGYYYGVTREITQRKLVEKELKEYRENLEEIVKKRTHSLTEANTALKVLLEQRGADRKKLERKVLFNARELITPYLKQLKKTELDDTQLRWLEIIESNLDELVAPFIRGTSLKNLKFTPTEIQVANLIKQGRSTAAIAELMNLSNKTVEFHRGNIRKKLGLKYKKINLRTFLITNR